MKEPLYCRQAAFQVFVESLPELETLDGLLRASVAISMHAIDDAQVADVDQQLWDLVGRVKQRTRSGNAPALIARLHEVLFEEEGFCGNSENYFSAINSYLPCVLVQKKGLPIALALIYKIVGERVGLKVHGVNSPGHFLLQVFDDGAPMIVDPFFCGQMLTRNEAFERLRHITGRPIPHDDRMLAQASHRQWIGRMIANLQALFGAQGSEFDQSAMAELQQALSESSE